MFSKGEKITLGIAVLEGVVVMYLANKIIKYTDNKVEEAGCKSRAEYIAKFKKASQNGTLEVAKKRTWSLTASFSFCAFYTRSLMKERGIYYEEN